MLHNISIQNPREQVPLFPDVRAPPMPRLLHECPAIYQLALCPCILYVVSSPCSTHLDLLHLQRAICMQRRAERVNTYSVLYGHRLCPRLTQEEEEEEQQQLSLSLDAWRMQRRILLLPFNVASQSQTLGSPIWHPLTSTSIDRPSIFIYKQLSGSSCSSCSSTSLT